MKGGDVSFLRKQESRYLVLPKSPSPGGAAGTAGLSHKGRGELLHSAKVFLVDTVKRGEIPILEGKEWLAYRVKG